MSELRKLIVAEARTWLRTPYHHQARVKGVGVDCVGLPIGIARSLGLVAPDFDIKGYSRTPDGSALLAQCDTLMERVAKEDIQPGDVIVIRWNKDPQHLCMVVDNFHGVGLSVVHAMGTVDNKGMVIERSLDESMLARFVRAYKLPGVTD